MPQSHPNKLYKYRDLSAPQQFERFLDILITGDFYFSKFEDLNDPMEGFFKMTNGRLHEKYNEIVKEKQKIKICSFSTDLRSLEMWTYYTNGMRGAVIELEIDDDGIPDLEFWRVEYIKTILDIEDISQANAKYILCHKLKQFEPEKEYRIMRDGGRGNKERLKKYIRKVHIGDRVQRTQRKAIEWVCKGEGIPFGHVRFGHSGLEFLAI